MTDANDDIVFDEAPENLDDSVVAEEAQGGTIKKLRERLKASEEKAKEYLGELQRAKADFVNMRKRDEEAKAEFVKFAKADVLEEILPALDALESAASGGDRGVEQTLNLFKKILQKHDLDESNPIGETFDPRFHEAVGTIPTEDKSEDHKVLEVVQKGYILGGKTLRPAKVRIGDMKI